MDDEPEGNGLIHEFVCANPDCSTKFVTDRRNARRCFECGDETLVKSRSLTQSQWAMETPSLAPLPA